MRATLDAFLLEIDEPAAAERRNAFASGTEASSTTGSERPLPLPIGAKECEELRAET
jgi:hypothetical protein